MIFFITVPYREVFCRLTFLFVTCVTYTQTIFPVDIVKLSKITLTESPTIKSNILSITNAEGNLQIQKSTFDYQLNSGVSLSRNTLNLFEADPRNQFISDQLHSRNAMASVGLEKTFRSSLVANLSVDYSMVSDNYLFNSFNQNLGPDINEHVISSTFSLTQPLLRGKGRKIVTAIEQASNLDVESTSDTAEFSNSYELFLMGSAYWQYLGAYKNVAIFKENEARVRRMLKLTQQLVKADKRPASDLFQIQADLANQERQTKVAEQNLYSVKLNLGRLIGLPETDSKKIGIPLNEFPTIIESGFKEDLSKTIFLNIAKKNRKDIQAVKKRQEALELQLRFAENSKKPQLDLTGFINYGGMNMGNGIDNAMAAFSRNEGRNLGYGINLNFSFPIDNNLASGIYIQNEVALKDQQISTDNLQRNIDLSVSVALNDFNNSVQVLEKAKESLKFYEEVYSNEQIKFKNGLTTLLNLILFQERLTSAELQYLEAHQQFAIAIINLRFETGTLLIRDGIKKEVKNSKELFYTIPSNN